MTRAATKIKEEAEDIAGRPYARELVKNEDGTWFARVVEFQGCMTEGDTAEEALANLDDAMLGWIEVHLEDGDPVPVPATIDAYSGKFMLRVAKSLHRDLARRADIEDVSLNAYVSTQLARVTSGYTGDGDSATSERIGKKASKVMRKNPSKTARKIAASALAGRKLPSTRSAKATGASHAAPKRRPT